MRTAHRYSAILTAIVLISCISASAQWRTPGQEIHSATTIPAAQQISPEELVKVLKSKTAQPLILNVGPRMLFAQARIPSAEFIGQGADPQALEALQTRMKNVPKTKSIVLYCGCCPWTHCPNVEPAFRRLQSLGFTKVKVLYLATNLGVDWVDKGYPTVRGQ